jgi:hypothetical protein
MPEDVKSLTLTKDQVLTVQLEFSRPLQPADAYAYDALVSGLQLALRGVLVTVDKQSRTITPNRPASRSIFAPVGDKGLLVRVRGPLDGATSARLERALRALVRSLSWRAGNPTGRPGGEVVDRKRDLRATITTKITTWGG